MNRKFLTLAALALMAGALCAGRPYNQTGRSKAAWMTVSSIKTGQEYYLEVAQDGQAVLREESSSSLQTRRGKIPPQLVKDFFREIDNSEIMNSQNVKQSKMVFYQGEIIKISAYISGELNRIESPLNNFGEAFAYAFGEVKRAVSKLPPETAVKAFVSAQPISGDELDAFRDKAAKDGEVKNIETYDIQKIKPLMAAIKEPYRLIPLETEEASKELQVFISTRQLYGLRTLFFLPSTRGTFKCQVVEAARKAQAAAPKKTAPAKKPAGAR